MTYCAGPVGVLVDGVYTYPGRVEVMMLASCHGRPGGWVEAGIAAVREDVDWKVSDCKFAGKAEGECIV